MQQEASSAEDGEGFHDYTVATTWEKFSAMIENSLRSLVAKELPRHAELQQAGGGPPATALTGHLRHSLPFRSETYSLTLHLPSTATATPQAPPASSWALGDHPCKLQEWFLPGPCLTLAPDSYSKRIFNATEAHTLLSAGAAALSHLGLPWPLLVPVHDALRDAYNGVALTPAGAVVHFDTDSLHTSLLPERFTQAVPQLELFASRLRPHCLEAAALCTSVAVEVDAGGWGGQRGDPGAAGTSGRQEGGGMRLRYVARCSYEVPDWPAAASVSEGSDAGVGVSIDSWDQEAPWRPWASEDDPVGCLELDVVWEHNSAEAVTAALALAAGGSEEHAQAAASWRLAALRNTDKRDGEARRPFLQLHGVAALSDGTLRALRPASQAPAGDASFSAMLRRMVEAWGWASRAQDVAQLASEQWWPQHGAYLPPRPQSFVLQDAVRDLFAAPTLPEWPFQARGERIIDAAAAGSGPEAAGVGKAAPLSVLATRLALHCLRLGNPRAVAMLWSRFLRELHFAHWEPLVALPRMGSGGSGSGSGRGEADGGVGDVAPERPDQRHCLLHQNLQLLQLSIHASRRASTPRQQPDGSGAATPAAAEGSDAGGSAASSVYLCMDARSDNGAGTPEPLPLDSEAAGAAGGPEHEAEADAEPGIEAILEPEGVLQQLQGLALLHHPDRPINEPLTQEAPAMTEDALLERQAALAALPAADDANGGGARARLQGALLLSDMQAFKAANPGCCLADFVRWHSPRDWVQASGEGGAWGVSSRIAGEGNAWTLLWEGAAAVPAARQRPLFQAALEGERALHFLETLPPAALYAQLLALSVSAAVALLHAAPAAQLPAVQAELWRLSELVARWLHGGVSAWAAEDQEAGGAANPAEAEAETGSDSEDVAQAPPPVRPLLHSILGGGADAATLEAVLAALESVEQTVAAGQSLLQRLSPSGAAAADADEIAKDPAAGTANALVEAALGCARGGPGCVVELNPAARAAVATVLAVAAVAEAAAAEDSEAGGVDAEETAAQPSWAEDPHSTEWAIEIFGAAGEGPGGGASAAAGGLSSSALPPAPPAPLHRLYVKLLPAELRIATTITARVQCNR